MKTQPSKSALWTRGLLILPLISLLFFSFSNKEIVEKEINSFSNESSNSNTLMLEVNESGKVFFQKNETEIEELQSYISNGSFTSYHIEIPENSESSITKDLIQLMVKNKLEGSVASCTSPHTEQDKASPEMIEEYNRLVKHYNSIPEEEFKIEQKVINRIMYIRSLMTPEQKKKAEKITFVVPPPPPPPAPAPLPIKAEPAPPVPPTPKVDSQHPVPFQSIKDVPAPPKPPSFEDLVNDEATFYYNGKEIKPEEAKILVEVEKQVNVQITKIDGKTEVNLTDKKP